MEELLKYFKEFLFKIFKSKIADIIYGILILIIVFIKLDVIDFFRNGFVVLNSNNILNYYNLPEEIIGIKYTEFWQLFFALMFMIIMILYPKKFFKKEPILKIFFEIVFSFLNTIIIGLILGKFFKNNNFVRFLIIHPETFYIAWLLLFLAFLEIKDVKESYYWLEIFWLKFIRKLKKISNYIKICKLKLKRKIKKIKFNKLLCYLIYALLVIVFFLLLIYNNIYLFNKILVILILLIMLKVVHIYKSKIFTLLKSVGISILFLIPLYSFFNISNKGPEDKREYFYFEKEKGIVSVVVYQNEEDYIIQNAKIINKILVLDTRSFYIVNKKDLYNKKIQVENFDEIIKGIVMNNEEARMKQEL